MGIVRLVRIVYFQFGEGGCKMKYGDDLRFSMSLKLWRNEKAFGPGIARLLELVEEYESLNKAASIMGMAYSKVWKILNDSEKALGFPLIERRIGGVGGGGANLTEEGKELLYAYRSFSEEANKAVGELFKKYFL